MSSGKTEGQILGLLSNTPKMTIPELAIAVGKTTRGVEKQIARLRREGRLPPLDLLKADIGK